MIRVGARLVARVGLIDRSFLGSISHCVLGVPRYPEFCVLEARPVRGKDRVHSADNTLTVANLLSACPADNRHHRKECS
jgi:hypothetical protein